MRLCLILILTRYPDKITASNIILLDQITQEIHSEWKNFFILHHNKLLETIGSIDWTGTSIFPPKSCIFKIFQMNPQDIKVVILGQDPYHGLKDVYVELILHLFQLIEEDFLVHQFLKVLKTK
jgi:hypothetical protein